MSLTYRGTSSNDVHFNVTERRVYNAPAFDVSGIEVPGRSGDVLNSQERFKNKAIVYTGFIRSSDFPGDTTWERLSRGLRTIKAWVCGDAGKYHDLTDDYDPGFVRRAFVSGETAISEVLDRPDGATITITFMAEPFMYEESDPIELPETGTASGAIASFEGVAAPLQSLKFSIEPSQDLHGYSYPWPGGGRWNVFPNAPADTKTANGITVKSDGFGTYTITGTATANAEIPFDLVEPCVTPISIGAGGHGCLYFFNSAVNDSAYVWFQNNGTTVDSWGCSPINRTNSTYSVLGGKAVNRITIRVNSGATVNCTVSPMFTDNDSTTSAFIPYSNICPISGWSQVDGKQSGEDMTDYTPITISLGQTVYGGTVDALNGKLNDDDELRTLTGNHNWQESAGVNGYVLYNVLATAQIRAPYISNLFKTLSASDPYNQVGIFFGQNNRHIYVTSANNISGVTDLASFKAFLNNNNLQIVIPRAASQEYDLSPVSGLTSLLGQNNIWCNTGDTEVVYVEPTENPTEWPSKPRLEITMAGAGTLTVNGKTWSIGAYTGTLICDSEIMDWYDASNLKNSLVSGDGFPELQPGENVITYTGGITNVVAKPRWRTL